MYLKLVLLNVDLQSGFTGDAVIVKINQEEVFRKKNVSTNLLLGYAEHFQQDLPEGDTTIEVELPQRNLTENTLLHLYEPLYLGISIEENRLVFITRKEAFSYV